MSTSSAQHEEDTPFRVNPRAWKLFAGLLTAAILLRIAVAWSYGVALNEPEEVLQLRLGRQLLEGQELGPLSRYWYTGVGGAGGAGTLILSVLYVPLITIFGGGFLSLRIMSLLWGVLGLLLVAALSQELFGRRAGLLGLALAGLAAPPAWLAFSTMSRGNYVEAAVLSMLSLWAFLRMARSDSARPTSQLWAFFFGFALSASVVFWPSALSTALLLGPAAFLWTLFSRRFSFLLWILVGLIVPCLPFVLGFRPPAGPSGPVGFQEVQLTLAAVADRPDLWWPVAEGSLAALPILSSPRTPASEWAMPWQWAMEPALRGALWAAFPIAFGPVLLRSTAAVRLVVLVLTLTAFGTPVALGAMGVGPPELPVRPIYFFDPRRSAVVYPAALVAGAGFLHHLWSLRGRLRLPGRVLVWTIVLAGFGLAVEFVVAGSPPPWPYHPERYLICPAEEPVFETSVCVDTQRVEDIAALERLALLTAPLPPGQRRAALEGFAALDPEIGLFQCEVDEGAMSSQPDPHGEAQWFGLGLALSNSCLVGEAESICSQAPSGELSAACFRGRKGGLPTSN